MNEFDFGVLHGDKISELYDELFDTFLNVKSLLF